MTFYLVLAGLAILLVAWFVWSSRPLSEAEIDEFARRRRVVAIEKHFAFFEGQAGVDLDFKRLMAAQGEFYQVDEPLSTFPSFAGGSPEVEETRVGRFRLRTHRTRSWDLAQQGPR